MPKQVVASRRVFVPAAPSLSRKRSTQRRAAIDVDTRVASDQPEPTLVHPTDPGVHPAVELLAWLHIPLVPVESEDELENVTCAKNCAAGGILHVT